MSRYTLLEKRAVAALAGIFSLRMLGLFMILPVFALYGPQLQDATPLLVGVAIGAYGLAQLLLQIPFGLLADRHDRRRLILLGLLLFVAGGLVAAASTSIWGVILGRFLQGAGAISAVVMALAADLVREENRTKVMATLGMSIGVSFALAFVLGPLLAASIGLSGLFVITALLGAVAVWVCLRLVPRAQTSARHLPENYRQQLRRLLGHGELLRLNLGIFTLHLVLTACFLALPPLLVAAGLPASRHAWLYLPVMLAAFVALVPAVIVAETRRRMREVYLGAIALLVLAMILLIRTPTSLAGLSACVALFFLAFNLLEALLPSLVSKLAPSGSKATAMSIYSTGQFLGAFLGGAAGGWLLHQGTARLFEVLAGLTLLWLATAWRMRQPEPLQSLSLRLARALADDELARLGQLPGVDSVVHLPDEAQVCLRVRPGEWQASALTTLPGIFMD